MNILGWSASFFRARAQYRTLPLAMFCVACAVSAFAAPSEADPAKAERRARRAGVNALARSTAPAAGAELLGYLSDEDPYTRGAAAEMLGRKKAPGALAALTSAAASEDDHTRWGGIDGLAELGDRRAAPVLIKLLKHADKTSRWKAAIALGRLGDARAVPGLTAAQNDSYAPVRRAAAEALRKVKR